MVGLKFDVVSPSPQQSVKYRIVAGVNRSINSQDMYRTQDIHSIPGSRKTKTSQNKTRPRLSVDDARNLHSQARIYPLAMQEELIRLQTPPQSQQLRQSLFKFSQCQQRQTNVQKSHDKPIDRYSYRKSTLREYFSQQKHPIEKCKVNRFIDSLSSRQQMCQSYQANPDKQNFPKMSRYRGRNIKTPFTGKSVRISSFLRGQ